jgi:cell division protein FtsB
MRPIKLKIALFSNGDSLPLSSHGRAERKRKKFVARMLTIAVALFMLTLLVKTVFGDRGFLNVLKIRSQYALLCEEVKMMEEKNVRLIEEVTRLKSDEYYKEKVAREKLGLARDGEIVFLFPDDDRNKNSFPSPD